MRVLLDLYGTNRDPKIWSDPDRFDPERFSAMELSGFQLIPQGGGEVLAGHRCAGEQVTLEIIKAAVPLLVSQMNYDVPEQDLTIRYTTMPAAPQSGFIISRVALSNAAKPAD